MESLKLIALDEEDLSVISAHVQDAVLKVSDIRYLKKEKRFALQMNRFVWEKDKPGLFRRTPHERRLSFLHFDRVLAVRAFGISQAKSEDVLSLLTIGFAEYEAPAGTIELIFSGDAAIQLDVECIEARLADSAAAWSTQSRPNHGA